MFYSFSSVFLAFCSYFSALTLSASCLSCFLASTGLVGLSFFAFTFSLESGFRELLTLPMTFVLLPDSRVFATVPRGMTLSLPRVSCYLSSFLDQASSTDCSTMRCLLMLSKKPKSSFPFIYDCFSSSLSDSSMKIEYLFFSAAVFFFSAFTSLSS